jgi:putative addiction module component (TIGR02574 family)
MLILAPMASSVENLEKLVLDLPEEERAHLAASLLDSLPGILSDQDDGVAEALRRDAELDAHPDRAMTFEQLDISIRNRRK